MQTDRELLELAAKAAGMVGWEWDTEFDSLRSPPKTTPYGDGFSYWSPLTDDGDALRLAVKLRLEIGRGLEGEVYAFRRHDAYGIDEPLGDDPCAATRRAITRAAAALGEKK